MARAISVRISRTSMTTTDGRVRSPARQAYEILHWGFVALPAVAGIDKFTHLLTNWDGYLAPWMARMSPLSVHGTMLVVGVIEIVAALTVAIKPKFGAYVVAAWLAAIIVNLVTGYGFLDVALRDFGLMLGAMALGRLAQRYDQPGAVVDGERVVMGHEPARVSRTSHA